MRTLSAITSSIFLGFALSCSKPDVSKEPQPVPIDFETDYGVELTAGDITSINIPSFGVVAAVEYSGGGFLSADASLADFMKDIPVRKDKSGSWKADPTHYWPLIPEHTVSFFAYAPLAAGTSAVGNWDDRSVTVTCVPDQNPSKHTDLCVAVPVLDRVGYDPVPLEFHHTLSRMSFSANFIGDLPMNNGVPICYLRIDELSLINIHGSNSMTVVPNPPAGEPAFSWDDFGQDAVKNARYDLSIGNLTLGEGAIPQQSGDNFKEFVTAGGYVYMLPQTINPVGADVKTVMDVMFSYVKNDNQGTVMAQFQIREVLPDNIVLMPATKYNLRFTIDITNASMADIHCESTGWINEWTDSYNPSTDHIIK